MSKAQKRKRLGVVFMVTWLLMSLFNSYQGDGFNHGGVGTIFLILGLTFLVSGAYQESKE